VRVREAKTDHNQAIEIGQGFPASARLGQTSPLCGFMECSSQGAGHRSGTHPNRRAAWVEAVWNAQEPTRRKIVFSIALFLIAATALFLSKLTKSRTVFYAQIECLCFHTPSVASGHSATPERTETSRLSQSFVVLALPTKFTPPTTCRPTGRDHRFKPLCIGSNSVA